MSIKEIKIKLQELGCKQLCNDNKTLCAYNQIQDFLSANYTPMKAIVNIWWEERYGKKILLIALYDDDNILDTGYTYDLEVNY